MNYERPFIRVVAHVSKKMCVFKTEKLGKIYLKIYKFLNHHACKKTLNNWKHQNAGRIWRSRALYLERQTRHHSESFNGCSSHRPQSVDWNLPSASRKNTSLVDKEISMSLNMISTLASA